MKIEYLHITVKPWTPNGIYNMASDREIYVEIDTSIDKYSLRRIVPIDDMKSFFDQIWEIMGNEVRRYFEIQDEKK